MSKYSVQILPGVRRLWMLDCNLIPPYVYLTGICGGVVALMTDKLVELQVLGDAVCKLESERVAGGWKQTATLSLNVGNDVVDKRNIAFVVEDMLGSKFLIGSKEPPFPAVKTTYNFGSASSDAAGCFLDVSHTSLRTLIPCVIYM